MPAMNARVTSDNPGRLINRLGKHFRHKIEAQWTETDGVLTFSIGVCRLTAVDNVLRLECQSDTEKELEELGQVVASHLIRFSGDEVAEVHWQTATA
ncbi:DUF2218 domain-containing protein [uncultured Marinobacter sp.]|uniref:DUF2218 domain-containing protein n=1 Tax=uncultured Marinobacter sp. TaxID=187379 RepID=UPI0025EA9256|nr:DUF2218 domain-containing protein [uncultured Marinobacter sp.]